MTKRERDMDLKDFWRGLGVAVKVALALMFVTVFSVAYVVVVGALERGGEKAFVAALFLMVACTGAILALLRRIRQGGSR